MSEEALNQEVENEDIVDEVVEEETTEVELSEDEQVARKYGWKPQEEWEGDPDEWVPAKVFNQRGEFIGKIKSLESQNREMQKAFKQMQKMMEKNYESGYKKAKQELESQRREAIESADAERAFELEKEIKELDDNYSSVQEEKPAGPPQEFVEFKDANPWYGEDDVMSAYADRIGPQYASEHPDKPLEDVYAFVAKTIREKFPDKFSSGKKMKESKVEGSQRGAGTASKGKQKFTEKDLNSEQRSIMNTIVKAGAMTKDQYIDELVRIGEIG